MKLTNKTFLEKSDHGEDFTLDERMINMANAFYAVRFNKKAFVNYASALEEFIASNVFKLNTFAGDYNLPYEINREEIFNDYSIAKEYFDILKELLIDAGYKVEEKYNTIYIGDPWDDPFDEEYISFEVFHTIMDKIPAFASVYKAHKEKIASVQNHKEA